MMSSNCLLGTENEAAEITKLYPPIEPMVSKLFVLALLALALALAIGCQPADRSWERVRASGVLRVGVDPTYPPFEHLREGQVVGIDVDLVRAIAGELNLRAEFAYVSYDGLYEALETGKVDLLISALVLRPERTRDFAYSESYFDSGQILITALDHGVTNSLEELQSKRVAVELGAQGHVEAIALSRRLRDLTIMPHNSAEEAMEAVASGDADAALVDAISGRLFLAASSGLIAANDPVTSEPFAIVVRNEDQALLDKVNEKLRGMKDSGQLEQIVGHWLPTSTAE